MLECTQRRTYKSVLGFFFGFLLFQGVFASPLMVEASAQDTVNGTFNPTSASVTTTTNGTPSTTTGGESDFFNSVTKCFANIPTCFLVPVFDAVANIMGRFAGAAAGLFIWVVDPANISGPNGILNKGAVYDLWRFIRDFFNLFFILILLLSAFATVFQLESFSIRKIFLNILLAALIINFSFPITRFLIDFTNVPMYYFLNSILPGMEGGKAFVDSLLANSGIGGIATQPASADVFQAFSGAVFMFLFAISLLVLGVMMLVRIVALTLLLVFSPFGFAASLLPGMQDLGRKWWAKFWNYAFFGPAAALVLLVAIRFQNEIGKDGTFGSIVGVATNTSPDAASASLMARVVFYAIPIILIWTAIGMANSFSIAGASKVVGTTFGMAKKAGRWSGKGLKFVAVKNPVSKFATGVGKGVMSRPFVDRAKQAWNAPSKFEAAGKGLGKGKGIMAGIKGEKDKYKTKLINEKVAKNKEEKISRSSALKDLDSSDEVTRAAAATSLAQMDNGIQSMEDLTKALNALNDPKTGKVSDLHKERAADIIGKADKKVIASTTEKNPDGTVKIDPTTSRPIVHSGIENLAKIIETLGKDNQKAISDLIGKLEDTAFEGSGEDMETLYTTMNTVAPKLNDSLKTKMFKEGSAKVLVEHLTRIDPANGRPILGDAQAVETVLKEIRSAKDVVASASLFQDARYGTHAKNFVRTQSAERQQEIKKAAAQESANPGIYA